MSDVLLPPWLRIARLRHTYADSTGVSPPEFNGPIRTASRGGDRLATAIELSPTFGQSTQHALERAALVNFLASLRGKQNRAFLFNPARRLRGSFPAAELLTNNTFADGTTGWVASSSATLTAADRILRGTLTGTVAGSIDFPRISAAVNITQYAPYIGRFFISGSKYSGATASVRPILRASGGAATVVGINASGTVNGMLYVAGVSQGETSILCAINHGGPLAGTQAGEYIDCQYASLSRCLVADGGGNSALRSDELDNAAWAKAGVTTTANIAADPFGTTLGDSINEDGTTGLHSIDQQVSRPTGATELCAYGIFRQSVGTRNVRVTIGNDGTNFGSAIFNVSAGTFGTVTNTGTATNARAFMVNLGPGSGGGNSWYLCIVVATAVSATTMRAFFQLANGTTTSYAGDGTSVVMGLRCGVVNCGGMGVPSRPVQSVASAVAGVAQTGSGIFVKGGPASMSAALLPGDEMSFLTSMGWQYNIAVAPLNFDAAGLGHLQVAVPIRGTLADNAPIIVHEPMGRFMFTGDAVGWDYAPGVMTTASADFLEAL